MSSVRKKLSSKGFTMVELLAAITILGIVSLVAIKGITGLIDRAKNERFIQQEKTLSLAAESYIQANSQLKPKAIGESKLINISDLRKANYLKEDIVNDKGESCMSNSVVRVYKLSKTEYSYLPALYCGSDVRPAEVTPPTPTATAYFTDASLKDQTGSHLVISDVSKARLVIKLTGGATGAGESVAIDGYSYSIEAQDSTGRRTVFDSGSLSANRKTEISVSFDLNDYIDLASRTDFYLKVSVINVHGGIFTIDNPIETSGTAGSFSDYVDPKCYDIRNQPGENEWINKYSQVKERTITVGCEDGDGSGCVRDTFSRTWPNKQQQSAEYGIIKIRDNAGNSNVKNDNLLKTKCNPNAANMECCVRVNVDVISPTITLGAYLGEVNKSTGKFGASNTKICLKNNTGSRCHELSASSSNNYSETIFAKDYALTNSNEWISGVDAPYGVAFKVNISDDYRLASWSWETNEADIPSINSAKFNEVDKDNVDSNFEDFQGKSITKKDIVIGFSQSGARKGVLTVKDIAGNDTQFIIYLNYSRGIPDPECNKGLWQCCDKPNCVPGSIEPSLEFYKYREPNTPIAGEKYDISNATNEKDKWSNTSIIAKPPLSLIDEVKKVDGLYFEYEVILDNTETSGVGKGKSIISEPDYNGTGYYFDNSNNNPKTNGKNKITVRVCDQAHNCTKNGPYDVWIDTVAPTCTVTSKSYYKNANAKDYYDGKWLGIDRKAVITAKCDENAAGFTTSGCTSATSTFSKTYDTDIAIDNAGAKGAGDGGTVEDVAGNVTQCDANITVKIDHQKPTCTTTSTLGSTSTVYEGNWLNSSTVRNGVRVTSSCNDTGGSNNTGSGCELRDSGDDVSLGRTKYRSYTENINTSKATANGNQRTVIVRDGAGNENTCGTKTVKIDKSAPSCSPSNTSSTWRNPSSVSITLNCSDTGGSGCDNNRHGTTKKYTTNTDQASTTIYDVAGNSFTCSYSVKLDVVKPTCGTKTGESTNYSPGPRTVKVTCQDNESIHSGCTTPNPVSKTFTADGATGKVTIKDKAGNSTDCPVNIYIKDEPEPVCPRVNGHIATDSELFGTAIDQNRTFDSPRPITYKHINIGQYGGTGRYTLSISSTDIIYNYLPINPTRGAGNYTSLDYNSSKNRPYAFGFSADWGTTANPPYNWCFAEGTECNGRHYCYARVCKTDACGDFLGWTAEAMNDYIKNSDCSYARCWCRCSTRDPWFN